MKKIDDSNVSTRLLNKNYSPLIIRKYMIHGWSMFIGIICDVSLSDLDRLVYERLKDVEEEVGNDIQNIRNICGYLNESIVEHYNSKKEGSVEGVYVLWYVDKLFCASAYGDLMQHEKCVNEFLTLVNMMPHI